VLLEGSRPAMVGQCQRGSTQLPGLPRTPSLPWVTLMETEMMQEVKAMPLLYVFCLFLKQQFVSIKLVTWNVLFHITNV
jgi:hypothetical protein